MAKRQTLPEEVRAELDALADALATIASGGEPDADLGAVFDAAVAAAHDHARPKDPWQRPTAVPLEDITRDRVRRLREEAGMSQSALARAMEGLGFPWHRQTVFQVETDLDHPKVKQDRRLTLGEILGVAALFGVPAIDLLLPEPIDTVDLNGSEQLPGRVAHELIVGRGGKVGTGGPRWGAAASLAPADVERPAHELWKRRSSKGDR